MRKRALVFGASGSFATVLISELINKDYLVTSFSSRKIDRKHFESEDWRSIESYYEIGEIPDFDVAFIVNGYFNPMKIVQNNMESIEKTIEVNLLIPTLLVYQLVTSIVNLNFPRNIIIVGSTSAYEGFAESADYCAAKHGLVGLVRALNQEFKETDLRFILFSFGTLDNPMGRLVHTSSPLLSEKSVAHLLVSRAVTSETGFEPEIIVRRRHV